MVRFYAELFVKSMCALHTWELTCSQKGLTSVSMKPEVAAQLYAGVGAFLVDCLTGNLDSTAQKCQRIKTFMEKKQMIVSYSELGAMLNDLRERLEDDLQRHVFLHLSLKEAEIYINPDKDWEEVIGRFSKVRNDVEESLKCLALDRYAAAVFHITQVAEAGVIEVGDAIEINNPKKGWGSVIQRAQVIVEGDFKSLSPVERKQKPLIEQLYPLMLGMQKAWRDKISHVENKLVLMTTEFKPDVASDIIFSTRSFMRRLAIDLPKPG